MKKIDLICYDFDGTLCNTLPDIVNSMNIVLEENGFLTISEAKVRSFIGSGISKLVERSVYCALAGDKNDPVDPGLLKKVGLAMGKHYSAHLMDNSYLYEDTIETLEYFSAYLQIIVSNKPQKMVETMLEHYGIKHYFDLIIGGDTLEVCKPDPAIWDYIKERMNLSGDIKGIMVGDSVPDLAFGRIAGLERIAVTYGYNDLPILQEESADYFIDHLRELKNII
ncbi:MAG: HAD-IA family hydrolase [Candidatus Marinimicrobia bacterium]|nr:HAD-IA family hydrolase [Candidatus Neomarinimicrobiota bacterium]